MTLLNVSSYCYTLYVFTSVLHSELEMPLDLDFSSSSLGRAPVDWAHHLLGPDD